MHPIPLNFLIYEENFIFFFIHVVFLCDTLRTIKSSLAPAILNSETFAASALCCWNAETSVYIC
jgi:hypothetical protein